MKSIILFSAIVSFATTCAFSATFAPTTLKLTAASVISYKFDGKALAIPVTVTGTPADVSFLVFTRNQGSKISKVTNGYLGWHYVNKVDTCVYMSPSNQMVTGANTINWDGKGKSGAAILPGEYAYYLFGYDNKSPKVKMSEYLSVIPGQWIFMTFVEQDKDGKPLARPFVYRSDGGITSTTLAASIISKWVIGNDPDDAKLVETTKTMGYYDRGRLAFLPPDNSGTTKFFHDTLKREGGTKVTRKWTWVPNGDAVLNTDWGKNGEYFYSGAWPVNWHYGPGVVSDGKDLLFLSDADISGAGKASNLIVINASNGSEVKKLDISKWWVNQAEGDPKVGGQNCGGPSEIFFRNGLVALGAHGTCVNSVMNPYADTTEDAVLWVNGNGDYIGDHNWDKFSSRPWVCNDYNTGPYKYTTSMDSQGFVIFPSWMASNAEGSSFGLYAPDGTGVAYKTFSESAYPFLTEALFIDTGSAYDGIYTTNFSLSAYQNGIWFTAHDSFKGVITSSPTRVDGAAPAAFSVAQNTPNPFNPVTTISFTLAKSGKTSVEVFNAAGQKIDTIVNLVMSAGSHSVIWNASQFSAGAYFYTVKSGEFSKTKKMTLIK
jgi:hypothetical protein